MPNKDKNALVPVPHEEDTGVDIPFRPSTIESVDYALFDWLTNTMRINSETFEGWKQVPVLWVTAERAVQSKQSSTLRDDDGMLILPIVTIERTGVQKDLTRKGVIQANIPEIGDLVGGVGGHITVAKKINVNKTADFANAAAARKYGDVGTGQINFNTRNKRTSKVVYDTYSVPTPVYITSKYEITIKTEYQEQMNEVLTPLVVYTGGVNQFIVRKDGHMYEAFIEQDFAFNNTVGNLEEKERIYETTIVVNVLAYLLGEGPNRTRPSFARRENAVEVQLPRERVMFGDIPDWTDRSFFRGGDLTPTHRTKVLPVSKQEIEARETSQGGSGGGGTLVTNAQTMMKGGGSYSERAPDELPFKLSNIENVDAALMEWLDEQMQIYSDIYAGWKEIPVLWVSAERSAQIKKDKGLRDNEGALIMPLIAVERTGVSKDPAMKGVIQANLPEANDVVGGVGGHITISKKINVNKTADFANAVASTKWGDVGTGGPNFNVRGETTNKVVYDIYSIPTPVYVTAEYEVTIRTQFQEQMNQILTPLVVYTGGVNQFILRREGNMYEGFIDQTFNFENSVGNLGEKERYYTTTLNIKVLAYLLGEGKNRTRPGFARRQNAVEVRLPNERVMVGDIPDWLDRAFFRGGEIVSTHELESIKSGQTLIPLMPSPRSAGAGAGGTDITAKDDGTVLTTKAASFNFAGPNVAATTSGNDVTVTITGSYIEAKDEGSALTSNITSLDFVGDGITATNSDGDVTVTVAGGGGSDIPAKDEGVTITSGMTSINFVGAGITATAASNAVTVTVTGSTGGATINDAIFNNSTYSEVPSGLVNGVNAVYTTSQDFIEGSQLVFNNGLLQRLGASFDYTVTDDDEITFTFAPLTGDYLLVSYVNKTAS
jgi:hypothetical protein